MNKRLLTAAIILALGIATTGCATKEYVHEYVQAQLKPVNGRVDALEGGHKTQDAQMTVLGGKVQGVENELQGVKATLKEHGDRLDSLSKTAQEALDRATAAGKLAEGKLLYEVVMTNDTLRFPLEKGVLSEEGKAALDDFAARIKAEGKPVFIEIQGHTDSTGPEAFNEQLGQQRAESVRRYLYIKGGLPLHRMSAVSYGESAPTADNKTREGRKQNRRVALVVLR